MKTNIFEKGGLGMARKPLQAGSIVRNPNNERFTYVIDKRIGDGASSIVYDAHYFDAQGCSHYVRLKECYPYASDIVRADDGCLKWSNSDIKERDFNLFVDAYKELVRLQNTDGLRNSSVLSYELCEANGTVYSVMGANDGEIFENDKSEKLMDIFITLKLLADVVGKYHKNGYLHLDIKPSNFLVFPPPSRHIVLFDTDTAVLKSDIVSGNAKRISYSKGWAAPEQYANGKTMQVCEASDIFAIGAILFYKIMERQPEVDDIIALAKYDLPEAKFAGLNPKIKRLVRNIFKKTINVNIKRRYQSTDELIEAIEEAIDCLGKGKPYVLSNCPRPYTGFIGRTKEIELLAQTFKTKSNVFLTGFGGIGKSELSKKYAEMCQNKYDAIIFLRYSQNYSIDELLTNIHIYNYETQSNETVLKKLRHICEFEKILFILDNFDVDVSGKDEIEGFLSLKADKIITTRTDFSKTLNNESVVLNIGSMNLPTLLSLFENEAEKDLTDSQLEIVSDILKRFNYYTLIVPILARQLKASGWTIEQLKENVDRGFESLDDDIIISKDEKTRVLTALDMIRATFTMAQFTEKEKSVLSNLYFLRNIRLTKSLYREIVMEHEMDKWNHINTINKLVRLGWIQEIYCRQDVYELEVHPIIVEVIADRLKPMITKSEGLCNYLQKFIVDAYGFNSEDIKYYANLKFDRFQGKIDWLIAILVTVNLKCQNDLFFVINLCNEFACGNIDVALNIEAKVNFADYIADKRYSEAFEIEFAVANWLEMLVSGSLIFSGIKFFKTIKPEKQTKILDHYFHNAYQLIDKSNVLNKDLLIYQICLPIAQVYPWAKGDISENILNVMKANEDICIKLFKQFELMGKTKVIPDNLKLFSSFDNWISSVEDFLKQKYMVPYENEEITLKLSLCNDYRHMFWFDSDISTFVDKVEQEKALDSDDIVSLYVGIITQSIDELLVGPTVMVKQNIKKMHWDRIPIARSILVEKYGYDITTYIKRPTLDNYCAIADVLSGNQLAYRELIEPLIRGFERYLSSLGKEQKRFYSFDTIDQVDPYSRLFPILYRFSCLLMNQYILEDLINISEMVREKFSLTDEEMYDWYRTIKNCAEASVQEVSDDNTFKMILIEYTNKCEKLTSNQLQLK